MADFDPVSYLMGQKAAGGGGGGGGSSSLSGLTDVDISNPTNGQTLVYNATSGKWENGESAGGVLFITVDENTMTMNRTWNEISNASFAVIVNHYDEDGATLWVPVTGCAPQTEGGSAYDVYAVQILPEGQIEPLIFQTDFPNGYPTLFAPDP